MLAIPLPVASINAATSLEQRDVADLIDAEFRTNILNTCTFMAEAPMKTKIYGMSTFTKNSGNCVNRNGIVRPPKRLLERLSESLSLKHYSIRTEHAYRGWVRCFILFHGSRILGTAYSTRLFRQAPKVPRPYHLSGFGPLEELGQRQCADSAPQQETEAAFEPG